MILAGTDQIILNIGLPTALAATWPIPFCAGAALTLPEPLDWLQRQARGKVRTLRGLTVCADLLALGGLCWLAKDGVLLPLYLTGYACLCLASVYLTGLITARFAWVPGSLLGMVGLILPIRADLNSTLFTGCSVGVLILAALVSAIGPRERFARVG